MGGCVFPKAAQTGRKRAAHVRAALNEILLHPGRIRVDNDVAIAV